MKRNKSKVKPELQHPNINENPIWGDDWVEVRKHWTIDPDVIFLNHGSFGATPRCVIEAQNEWRARLERQPVHFLVRELPDLINSARHKCAAFLNADVDGLVFVPNATYAVNYVVKSLPIGKGDEILVTNHVYPAVYNTMDRLCHQIGATLVMQDVPLPEVDSPKMLADAFLAGITDRTRFVVIEHIASATGLVFPIKQIVDACRARGIWCLVDAAHGPGMYDIDLAELDPDFWTGNYHKWVCAPKVSAGLYVRREFRETVRPTITSNYAGQGLEREFFWTGTHDPTPFLSTPNAIDFMTSLNWNRVRTHNHELVRYGRQVIADAVGTTPPVFDSIKYFGSMALVRMPDSIILDTDAATEAFRKAFYDLTRVEATFVPWMQKTWMRLSAQVHNAPAEYDHLAAILPAAISELT